MIYEGGSVVIHMEDVRTGRDVWFAWADANIEPALTSPDAMKNWVYKPVGDMSEEWDVPPRGGRELGFRRGPCSAAT